MNITVKTLSAFAIAAAAFAATAGSSSALTFREPPGGFHCLACTTQTKAPPFRVPPGGFHCFVCGTQSKNPPVDPKPPGYGSGYGHGWGHGRFGHPEIIVEGGPVAVGATPVSGLVAAAPKEAAASPCNCLTKQNLPDGSVLFEDICTKQSAIAPAVTVGSR
jgi:hypothetical protein